MVSMDLWNLIISICSACTLKFIKSMLTVRIDAWCKKLGAKILMLRFWQNTFKKLSMTCTFLADFSWDPLKSRHWRDIWYRREVFRKDFQNSEYWIRDILIWIRIIRSFHWITDRDPKQDPALFGSVFQDANKVGFFSKFVFAYFSQQVHLHRSLKIICSSKPVEVMVYLNYFACWSGSGS